MTDFPPIEINIDTYCPVKRLIGIINSDRDNIVGFEYSENTSAFKSWIKKGYLKRTKILEWDNRISFERTETTYILTRSLNILLQYTRITGEFHYD